jgi:hypothetical protein
LRNLYKEIEMDNQSEKASVEDQEKTGADVFVRAIGLIALVALPIWLAVTYIPFSKYAKEISAYTEKLTKSDGKTRAITPVGSFLFDAPPSNEGRGPEINLLAGSRAIFGSDNSMIVEIKSRTRKWVIDVAPSPEVYKRAIEGNLPAYRAKQKYSWPGVGGEIVTEDITVCILSPLKEKIKVAGFVEISP